MFTAFELIIAGNCRHVTQAIAAMSSLNVARAMELFKEVEEKAANLRNPGRAPQSMAGLGFDQASS